MAMLPGGGGVITRRRKALGVAEAAPDPGSIDASVDDGSLSVVQGSTVEVTVTLVRTGFLGAVTPSIERLPVGCTAEFSVERLTGATLTTVVTITAAADAPLATDAAFAIRLSGGNVEDAVVDCTLDVEAAAEGSIAAAISLDTLRVHPASSVERIVSVARTDYEGAITISVTGLPAGCTYSVGANLGPWPDVDARDRFEVSIVAGDEQTPVADHPFTVIASGVGIADSEIECALTVQALPDFLADEPEGLTPDFDEPFTDTDYWNGVNRPVGGVAQLYGGVMPPDGLTYLQGSGAAENGGTGVSIETGVKTPYGTTRYRNHIPGDSAGAGTGMALVLWSAYRCWRKKFQVFSFKLSANYQIHANPAAYFSEKFDYVGYNAPDDPTLTEMGHGTVITLGPEMDESSVIDESGAGPYFHFGVAFQSGDPSIKSQTFYGNGKKGVKGEDHILAKYIEVNTPGNSDGVYKLWLDGTLIINKTGIKLVSDTDHVDHATVQAGVLKVNMDTTRGGGSSLTLTPPEGQDRFINRLYVSGEALLTL